MGNAQPRFDVGARVEGLEARTLFDTVSLIGDIQNATNTSTLHGLRQVGSSYMGLGLVAGPSDVGLGVVKINTSTWGTQSVGPGALPDFAPYGPSAREPSSL